MSIPIICRKCGEFIGIESAWAGMRKWDIAELFPCPGKGKHEEEIRYESTRFFGWVKRIFVDYPETYTSAYWEEYIGPKWAKPFVFLRRHYPE